MKFVFVLGHQQFYAKSAFSKDRDRLHYLRAVIKNPDDFIFFINWAFDEGEYNEELGLPKCLLADNGPTFVPDEVLNRARFHTDMTVIIHRKEEDFFGFSKPLLEQSLNTAMSYIDKDNVLESVEIYNLTDRPKDSKRLMLELLKHHKDFFEGIKFKTH